MFRFSDPVEVLAAPLSEGAYASTRDWARSSVVWSGLGHVQPDGSVEAQSPARETAQERMLIYLPVGVPVSSTDRIRYHGGVFEVDGEPMRWPHGGLRHVRIRVWRAMH
ncbi:hypothetical protein ACQEVX_30370 [Streptomyces syringium]|uniref:hypothetical protein n=1 Tax=Streptomyces syringium TaxID=76729 RepID=UPI003D8F30BA